MKSGEEMSFFMQEDINVRQSMVKFSKVWQSVAKYGIYSVDSRFANKPVNMGVTFAVSRMYLNICLAARLIYVALFKKMLNDICLDHVCLSDCPAG